MVPDEDGSSCCIPLGDNDGFGCGCGGGMGGIVTETAGGAGGGTVGIETGTSSRNPAEPSSCMSTPRPPMISGHDQHKQKNLNCSSHPEVPPQPLTKMISIN